MFEDIDDLYGYVKINNIDFPFHYYNNKISVILANEKDFKSIFSNRDIHNYKEKNNLVCFKAKVNIYGIALFIVNVTPVNYDNIVVYDVNTIYLGMENFDSPIDSISIIGEEINSFTFVNSILPEIIFDDNKNYKKFKLDANSSVYKLGEFCIDNIHIRIEMSSIHEIEMLKNFAFKTSNKLFIYFSENVDIHFTIKIFEYVKKVFMLLCYRKDIGFENYSTYHKSRIRGIVKKSILKNRLLIKLI